MKTNLLCLLAAMLACGSCIQDELPEAECDILAVDAAWLSENAAWLNGAPAVSNRSVTFTVQRETDRSALAPRFALTPGARLTAVVDGRETEANGLVRNFNSPQTYTAHSADGKWSKDYTVAFNYPLAIKRLTFDNYELQDNAYHRWYETDPVDTENPKRYYWDSGNSGFKITGVGKNYDDYPTAATDSAISGKGVRLRTCDTGAFGKRVNMPIAAGNLFIGRFVTATAVAQPLRATMFGLPEVMGGRPLRLEGYYTYTAGETMTDKKGNVRPELRDTADIYAVLYELPATGETDAEGRTTYKAEPLDGDNVLTSERIVLMARIDNPGEPQEWTRFVEPFREVNGKTFDYERLRLGGYALSVVLTSSRQGAYFVGAVGSTLHADELNIVWEGDPDQ